MRSDHIQHYYDTFPKQGFAKTTYNPDHPKTVHENAQSPKCLGKTSHNSNGNEKAVGLTVHENVKPSNVKPSYVSGENASGENVKHKVKCKQLLL